MPASISLQLFPDGFEIVWGSCACLNLSHQGWDVYDWQQSRFQIAPHPRNWT